MRGIEQLLDEREEEIVEDPGARNFRCEDCNACYDCRFCMRCDSCSECTYCEDSVECTGCTQCRRCLGCEGSSYCEDSRDCTGSRYLTLCVECADCVHCLGCVGLRDAEFHVLNRKVPRREYFELLKRVQAELEERAGRGWRPEVIGLESVDEPAGSAWDHGDDGERDEEGASDDEGSAWLDDEDDGGAPTSRTHPGNLPSGWDTPASRSNDEAPARREGLRRGRRPPRRS